MSQQEKSRISITPKKHTKSKRIELDDHQTNDDNFEFFSDQSFEMSHAEDIFLCGKLLPLQQQQQQRQPRILCVANDDNNMLKAFHERRCESLSDQKTSDQWSTSPRRLRRNSKSLDYRKMNMLYDTSPNNGVRGLSQNRSLNKRKSDNVEEVKVSKPRWYIMLFGLLAKIPHQEMDLQDIKIRQTRRKAPFEAVHHQNESSKSSWGMLNVLSCKSNASIAVASGTHHILL